jgi:hypothetical protein
MASEEGDERDRLEQLRSDNEQRWSRLEALHQELQDASVGNDSIGPSLPRSMANLIETEIAMLPQNEITVESSGILNAIIVQGDKVSDDDVHQYATLESFQEQHRQVLEELRSMELSRNELVDSDTPMADTSDERREAERQRLQDDLKYVAHCIEEEQRIKAHGGPSTSEGQGRRPSWSLDELLLHLVSRLCKSPDDPFVVVGDQPVNPAHVALLRQFQVAQVHKDDSNLLRLTDYRD